MNILKMLKIIGLSTILAFAFNGTVFADDHKHTKLEDAMSAQNKAFKVVRRQAKDASKNKDSAKLVGKMISQAKKGLKYEPKWTVDQPKGEQKSFVAGYKKEMKNSIAMLEKLKKAFEKGDNDKAQNLISEIRDHQKKSHKKYKKPKPKKN